MIIMVLDDNVLDVGDGSSSIFNPDGVNREETVRLIEVLSTTGEAGAIMIGRVIRGYEKQSGQPYDILGDRRS